MDTKTDPTETHATVLLRYASIETLLRTAYSLTHRIHAADDTERKARQSGQYGIADASGAESITLREQRNLIDAEIARRCER